MAPRGHLEKRIWKADFGRYGGRPSRGSFSFEAYVPDAIADYVIVLPGDMAEVIGEAEREIVLLNREPPELDGLEALARQLLRAESLASSRIEGLTLSHRRLAKAAAARDDSGDVNARSVVANIAAMEEAIALGASATELTTADIVTVHETLFRGTRDEAIAGAIRTKQNWIGGNADTPRDAEFIPPPADRVTALLDDLCEFVNRDDLPAVAQAAIAHGQFETIHPFPDGNGRVGRCLIHAILRRRGLAPRYVPPISLVLATDVRGYERGLTDYREGADAEWCAVFAQATRTAAREAEGFAREIAKLQGEWLERAGNPRRDSAVRKLVACLPAHPIVDVAAAMEIAGVSDVAAGRAIERLERAGVLRPERPGRRRQRSWEAAELFDLVDGFERRLAIPSDSRTPARPVPVRTAH
jgi:Fic family protein